MHIISTLTVLSFIFLNLYAYLNEYSDHIVDQYRPYSQYTTLQKQSRLLQESEGNDPYINGNGSKTVFPKPDFIIAMSRAIDVMNLIYHRYEFHNHFSKQFFLASFNMHNRTWDMIKYKIAKKSIRAQTMKTSRHRARTFSIRNALVFPLYKREAAHCISCMKSVELDLQLFSCVKSVATGAKEQYLMIFGGSSVTAGHDNYFNQSYPMVVHRRMQPIFDALGIELFTRNIAQGANPCRPSDLCYEAMGGTNPDWIGWEQSFNCKGADIFELMARLAVLNNATLYLSASGGFLPDYCLVDTNDTIPWTSEEWSPDLVNITNKIIPNTSFISSLKATLHAWYEDGNAVARFSGPLRGEYVGAGIHGFSVWGRSSHMLRDANNSVFECDAYCARPQCFEAGGPHWMSKDSMRYGLGGGKKWHPTVGFHLLRGEIMVYNYLAAIIDSIKMMENDLLLMTPSEALSKYEKALDDLYVPPPRTAIHCYKEECDTKPRCYTDFAPNYNPASRLDNIITGNHTGWEPYVHSGITNSPYGYLDIKRGYQSFGEGHRISFRVNIPHDKSLLIVCGTEKDALKHTKFYYERWENSDAYQPINMTLIIEPKHRGDECVNLFHLPAGQLVLSVVTTNQHRSAVTHIVSFE